MYVGSSTFPSKRVFTHERCQGKDFDAVWFLPCDEAERVTTELHWIRTLCPVHNKAWNPNPNPDFPGWGGDPNDPGLVMTVKLTGDLLHAFFDFRESHRVQPAKSDIITLALQEFFKAEGFYPPRRKS